MQIISTIHIDDSNQWIESFAMQALENAGICCEQAIIEAFDEDKILLLDADGRKYRIQLLAFLPIAADMNGMVCTENVQYILYQQDQMVDDDFIRIQRGNQAAYEEATEKTLF